MDSQGKVEPFHDPSPGANGALVDPLRREIVCESQGRRMIRIERGRSVTQPVYGMVSKDGLDGTHYTPSAGCTAP